MADLVLWQADGGAQVVAEYNAGNLRVTAIRWSGLPFTFTMRLRGQLTQIGPDGRYESLPAAVRLEVGDEGELEMPLAEGWQLTGRVR